VIASSETDAFDRGVRPLMKIVLPEKADVVVNFRADATLQSRIEELTEKSTEGQLTDSERAEYAGYVRANKFIPILQRQARQLAGTRAI
jgi:hypothetical protein